MPSEIVLLMSVGEAEHFGALLLEQNPALTLIPVETRAALETACLGEPAPGGRRLIAFCTSVIVPADVLAALDGDAYNFHPAPPSYPGRYPSSFALYDGAATFGATVHVMESTVDTGAIVSVETFPVAPEASVMDIEVLAYRASAFLFEKLAPSLALSDDPLPVVATSWSGVRRTKKDYQALMDIAPDMDAAEVARRQRACRTP